VWQAQQVGVDGVVVCAAVVWRASSGVVVQLEQQAGGVFCFVQAHAERAQTVICPLIYGGKLLIFASAHALCT